MLCVYVFVLFFLGYEARAAALPHKDVIYFSNRLENVIRKKCLENADENKAEIALNGLKTFMGCWMVDRPDRHLSAKTFYSSCMENTQNFTSYLSTFLDKLKPCLEPKESYLPQFALDSYGKFDHYFCTFLSAAVRRSSPSKDTIEKCYKKFEQEPETDPKITCYKDSYILGDNSTVNIITKTEICNDISQIYSCYEAMFDKNCPDSSEFRNVRLILLAQALENCPGDNNNILRRL